MNRRRYLEAISSLPAGYTGFVQDDRTDASDRRTDPESANRMIPMGIATWRHVDVVEYGADPAGEEDVTPVLNEIIDEEGGDELVVLFPPGTYRMEEGFEHENFHDFAVFGYNATIEVSPGFEGVGVYNDKAFALGPSESYGGRNVYVGGFEFDFGSVQDDVQASAVVTYGSGNVVFDSLETVNESPNSRRMIELIALDDGRGRIHNCVVQGAPGAGFYVETAERTTVKITDCLASNCADNGFYCSNGSGRVVIENSTAIDNDISNIRLGGTVRDSIVFVTDSELANARGYWLRNRSCRVENCFGYNDADDSRVLVEVAPSARSVTVTDSRFGSDSDRRIATINAESDESEHSVTFRDCTFFGEKNANSTEEAINVDRRETAFLECFCALTGDVHPIRFGDGAENCRVVGGRYVSVRPIVFTAGRGGLVRDADLVTEGSERLQIDSPDVVVENVTGDISEGVRTVINGVGDNGDTDPATGGDWHENGLEGVLVTWTDASADEERLSVYRNGQWYSWSAE